ncbi:bolA-like protein domain-containing protein [Purpureocillium lilacinum]|uniref:BolA-like protein domain-containing protein n=1 Tax=Purpureocillium lilacinum TaxID=33203 RepID=A0A179HX74_PURLI|nr:bolA-like protein domain-containing protein [Purpureocillium lilacinum]KAK4086755.1 hypothetical protein Purlil1_8920 [Purpureocillium lilacinum]OAQ86012.1 bolA-like protein domain-containing protein [Purpureocillium lilacinum]OAQ93970.1 bolA-like protein domain-containing protein [Purpureocillium lilacinum]
MICSSCRAALRTQRSPPAALLRPSSRSIVIAPRALLSTSASPRRPLSPRHLSSRAALSSSSTAALPSPTPARLYSSSSTPPQRQPTSIEDEDPLPAMTPAEASIAAVLSAALDPTFVLVQDVSGGCGSMYAIQIASRAFRGQTLLKQQRMVNAALGDRVKEWHGVQIRTVVPEEEE